MVVDLELRKRDYSKRSDTSRNDTDTPWLKTSHGKDQNAHDHSNTPNHLHMTGECRTRGRVDDRAKESDMRAEAGDRRTMTETRQKYA